MAVERELGTKIDIVLMVQGDEPLIVPEALAKLLAAFDDPSVEIANLMGTLLNEAEFSRYS